MSEFEENASWLPKVGHAGDARSRSRVHVEERRLVVGVGGEDVGVVAEQEPEVGLVAGVVGGVGVAHRPCRWRPAKPPSPITQMRIGRARARRRGRAEVVVGVVAGERAAACVDPTE